MAFPINHDMHCHTYLSDCSRHPQQTVENILNQNGLVYSREETYLDSEKMYMVTFMTEIIITEGE